MSALREFLRHSATGRVGLALTLLLFTVALAATAFGIVLNNAGLSGFAAALLIMCFARPAAETV